MINTLFQYIEPYTPQIISFILTVVSGIIFWIFEARVRLVWSQIYSFSYQIPNTSDQNNEQKSDESKLPALLVNTSTIFVKNEGRSPANAIEVILNYEPTAISIWPQRQYSKSKNPEDRVVLSFDSLAPKENFTVNLIDLGKQNPWLLSVRCKQMVAKNVEMFPVRTFPYIQKFMLWALIAIGLFSIIWFVLFKLF